jgi:hypothetical protein
MKFAIAEKAPPARSQLGQIVAWVYGAVLVVMVIGQLFAFEKFLPLMEGYGLPGGHGTASLLACLIVFTEAFSLPFLLRMPLSPLMRWFSLVCAAGVPIIWLKLSVIALLSDVTTMNSGLLGAKVTVQAGGLQLIISIILFTLAIWSVYGLWPIKKSAKKS